MPDETGATTDPIARVAPLAVRGLVHGRALAFDGALALGDDGLTIAPIAGDPLAPAPLVVGYDRVDGARAAAHAIALHLAGGDDLVELSVAPELSPQLAAALAEVTRRACALPELAHHLRGFGSERARPGSDHDRFFAPLLAARRAAALAPPLDQLRTFDPDGLRAAAEQALADFAGARFPDAAPDRRALEAELTELAEPLWASLAALGRTRDAARASPDETRFLRWREWAATVRTVYAATDRVWVAALPALANPPGREGRRWHRVLGRGRDAHR